MDSNLYVFCLLSFWKCWGKVQILCQRDDENSFFSNQQKCWWWWTRFSRSLTQAALKVALVTLSRPLWGGLRISFQPESKFHHKDWILLQRESACSCKHLTETSSFFTQPILWAIASSWAESKSQEMTGGSVRPSLLNFCIKISALEKCLRPYHLEYTSSRPITEVKQGWDLLVLGWVTAWEYRLL